MKAEVRGLQIVLGSRMKYADMHDHGIGVKRRQFMPDAKRKLPAKWQKEYETILLAHVKKALQ